MPIANAGIQHSQLSVDMDYFTLGGSNFLGNFAMTV
jgi:hypothetical protein